MKLLAIKRYLAVLLLLPSLVWVCLDKSLWFWDPAYYGTQSILLWRMLTQHPALYFHTLLTVMTFKAPGICWVGQFFAPLGAILGYEKALLLMQLIVSLGMLFILCRPSMLSGTRISLIAMVLLISSTPIFIFQSHFYFVEALQAFGVVLVWDLFLRRKSIDVISMLLAFIMYFSFLLAVKITSPAYIVLPSLFIFIELINRRHEINLIAWKQHVLLLMLTLLVTSITILWYSHNYGEIVNFAKSVSSGAVALHYGHKADFITKFTFWFINTKQLFWGGRLAWLFEILCGVTFLFYCRQVIDLSFCIAIIQIFIVLSLMSFQINEETRYLYPLLAYWIYVFGKIITRNKLFAVLFICLLGFRWGEMNLGTLGVVPLKGEFPWAIPVDNTGEDLQQSRQLINTLVSQLQNKPVMVGVDTRQLNPVELQFVYFTQYPAIEYYPITSFGYAPRDLSKVLQTIKDQKFKYLVTLPLLKLTKQNDFLNQISLPLVLKLKQEHWAIFSEGKSFLILKNKN